MNADGTGARGDHQRELHAAQRADLEPRRPLHRGAQAFHHPAFGSAPARSGSTTSRPGGGQALVERPNPQHQKELGEPIFAPDGRSIYFTRNTTPGADLRICAGFEPAGVRDRALRYRHAASAAPIAGGPGGAVRPTPSPDGRWLAFVRREGGQSRLFVKDLRSGEERRIYDDLDQDLQETWAVHGVYPNMDWTPDSRAIVFWAGGKIRRINAGRQRRARRSRSGSPTPAP